MGDLVVGLRSASIVIPAHNEEHALRGPRCAPRPRVGRHDPRGGRSRERHHRRRRGCSEVVPRPVRSVWASSLGHRDPDRIESLGAQRGRPSSERLSTALPRHGHRAVPQRRSANGRGALSRSTPMLAAPRIPVAESRPRAPRCYGRMWSQLPYVRSHVPGVGFYAVNEAGRQRWWRFPVRIGADDKFVRLHFDHSEARVIDDASFTVYMPERLGELLKVKGRWTSTNREIARSCPGLDRRNTSRWMSSARHLACNSSTWTDAPYFLGVWSGAWGWALLRTMGVGDRWPRAASSPMQPRNRTARPVPRQRRRTGPP